MSDKLENRRIFLLAGPDAVLLDRLGSFIRNHVMNATVWTANDGLEAVAKMQNVPPHVLICTHGLPKMDEIRVAESVIKNPAFRDTAVILLREIPESSLFVDEIVTGRVQFLDGDVEGPRFSKALARALNDVASREGTEFTLRFLTAGDLLLKKGDQAKSVYLVRRGKLRASQTVEGTRMDLGDIETGEFVGEMAYINGSPRSADVNALTDCELIEIPVDLLDGILFKKPSWSKALMLTLSKRVKKANERRVVSEG